MIRIFISVLCMALLSACGSDDATPTLDVNFDSQKGSASGPNLVNVQVESWDDIDINSRVSEDILEEESFWLSYTATSTQLVMVKLSSTVEDLDLFVYGENYDDDWYSAGFDSNELVLFEAEAGKTYDIEVWAWLGEGEFTLEIAEPSRGVMALSSNEYVYLLNEQQSFVCDDDESESNFSSTSNFIINYQDGYVEYWGEDERVNFTSVNDYTVILKDSFSGSDGDESYSSKLEIEFTVNPDTGDISGTEVVDSTEQYEGESYTCRYESEFEGSIVF